ncbi:MAG TPA: DUF2332 domain-containing protein [Ilumatobacteraceae bacterium]
MNEPELPELFSNFGRTCLPRAPFYARLSESIANDPATARLLLHAPPSQRLPVLLFACVHWLLLTEPEHELRRFYPNLVDRPDPGDPYPEFRAFCARHEPRMAGLLATRSTQTNEVGRCALFLPPFGQLADEMGGLTLVDVGTSAGLNLLLDRYEYRYEPGGTVGARSSVRITCGTRGTVPVPAEIPPIVSRIGLDRAPVDVHDDDATAWLEACVWPDQRDRFQRLQAAIAIGRDHPPDVRAGDAIDDLADIVGEAGASGGHPVVMNSWVLSYFSDDERRAYLDQLDELGAARDMSWVYVESPALVTGLPVPDDPDTVVQTVVSVARWRDGRRTVEHVGTAHPHGFWLHWHQSAG